MNNLYVETRSMPPRPPVTLASDVARHMQSRQYLGTTLVVCDAPHSMLSAVRKQWLKAARQLQNMRASTLNAEEILRLTHAIMHMQNMLFVAKSPQDSPDALVYFVTPEQLTVLPYACHSLYITAPLQRPAVRRLVKALPQNALLVAYFNGPDLEAAGVQPKHHLESVVGEQWQDMQTFLKRCDVYPERLIVGGMLQLGALDDALDNLLAHSGEFLQRAAGFQHTMSLAQPLVSFPPDQQRQFEIIVRLAHRVQSLSPGTFNSYLLKTFGDSEATTYFLRDIGSEAMYRLFD